jgi:hypothetical protein
VLALIAGHLVDGVEYQQNANNEEAQSAPILEIAVPAGSDKKGRKGEHPQQNDDPKLRN